MANTIFTPPAYNGYRFMPAGISKDHFNGLVMYVRYCRSATPSKIRVKQRTALMIWVVCPDREIVIVRNADTLNLELGFYPDQFDECINLNIFDTNVSQEHELSYIMQNYVEERNTIHGMRKHGNPLPVEDQSRLTIVADSGGFQIATEKSDFINPQDLGRWYNQNIDAGMTLDIPISMDVPEKLLRELATIQTRSTDLALGVLKPHTDLIQITHGKDIKARRLYREIVEEAHPDLNRIAYGGFGSFDPLSASELIMDATYSGKRYSQYHFLGITSSSMMPLLAYAANYGDKPPHITSDSTSHLQASVTKGYFMNSQPGLLRAKGIGLKDRQINPHDTLSCSCPICSKVKYTDVLGVLPGRAVTTLMFLHNINQTNEYSRVIQDAAVALPTNEFIEFIKGTHATHSPTKQKNLISALDLVRRTVDSGFTKAQKHHRSALAGSNSKYHEDHSNGSGLFGSPVQQKDVYADRLKRLHSLKDIFLKNLSLIESGEHVEMSALKKSKNRGGTQGT